ncbi:MAG: Crp/Fnr family transcriptional regulator [Flavobacteriales bacterium]|nr:Crp/Fnr family transcriptional regulator [Flavobacteriales bacterium]
MKEDTIMTLAEMIPVIAPSKGTILVEAGKVPSECYSVLEGLVREYQFIDGIERTTAFYTESNSTVSSDSYTDQIPSPSFIECSEDCLLIAGNLQIEEEHFDQFPELKEITRNILESDLNRTKNEYKNFILSSPLDRYKNFLRTRPDLVNRVPLNQIASYLGMTPESLSRIRKRLVSPD